MTTFALTLANKPLQYKGMKLEAGIADSWATQKGSLRTNSLKSRWCAVIQ